MLTLDQTWIRQGLVAVPWVCFGQGSAFSQSFTLFLSHSFTLFLVSRLTPPLKQTQGTATNHFLIQVWSRVSILSLFYSFSLSLFYSFFAGSHQTPH